MRRLLLLAVTGWFAAALQEIDLEGYDPSPSDVSKFRLLVPMMVEDQPDTLAAPRLLSPFTLSDRDVDKHDRDLASYYRDLINHDNDFAAHDRNIAEHDRKVTGRDRGFSKHNRDVSTPKRNVKMHDNHRGIKIYLYGFDLDDTFHDRANRHIRDRSAQLHDGENRWVKILHGLGDREGAPDPPVVLVQDAAQYRASLGPRETGEGTFSDIPSSEFTLDSGERRPSVKKQLGAAARLDGASHSRGRGPSLCCALRRPACAPAPQSARSLDSVPRDMVAQLVATSLVDRAQRGPEELLTALLASRRDWQVINSNYPENMKQFVLVHKNGTLFV